jgi:hypothetical protein
MNATATLVLFRPFLWLAAIAFLVGFVSSLVFGGGATAVAAGHQHPHSAAVSGPASDDWNLPKRI